MKVNKYTLGRFDDFIAEVKGKAKKIYFRLEQSVNTPEPKVIDNQLIQSPTIFRAAIILTAVDEVNDRGEKNCWIHLWKTMSSKINTREDADKWDMDVAQQMSKLKQDIQGMAPGMIAIDGFVEVV
jgi:hypothetical protein